MTLADLLSWAQERWESPPVQLHRHEVWADEDGGSLLGTRAWTVEFRQFIEGSPYATIHEEQVGATCRHPQQGPQERRRGLRCSDCDDSGLVNLHRLRWRWPMRRALAQLAKQPVKPGRPRHDAIIWQLALNDFSVARATATLARDWPLMNIAPLAKKWTLTALLELRRCYSEEAPGRVIGWVDKSDSQRAAESEVAA